MPPDTAVTVSISVDTEEDDWATYAPSGATTRNIAHLVELQELVEEFGGRPTYLVNRPPLLSADSVEVLGSLAARDGVEIGAHCHPWNTPPGAGRADAAASWMFRLEPDLNQAMIHEVRTRIESELGVRPTTFRAGRWGWGPTVAAALPGEGFLVDSSVSPLVDWSPIGGPDFSCVGAEPYRFEADDPFRHHSGGALVELPTTIAFLKGRDEKLGPIRARLERSPARHLGVIGLLDRLGVLSRRWLSPEVARGSEMIELARRLVARGRRHLDVTFHSSVLLPGATPFVRSPADRARFLADLRTFLEFAGRAGYTFRTLGEVGRTI